jgi:hypothetical protein
MTRTQTLLLTTAIAFTVPLAAFAQSTPMKCGPVAFSADKMAYTSGPCTGAPQQPVASVGTAGPTAYGSPNATTMTKAEMIQGTPAYGYAPMQAQAVAAGPSSGPMMSDQCGSLNSVAITDEYGRKYNCRGDRIGGGRRR